MTISAIAAIGENKELGAKNALLWNIPGELKRFKEITTGHPIIMGRRTFESIGRILPNRTNIVITRAPNYKIDGAIVVNSLNVALDKAKDSPGGDSEVFIIGGGQIFKEALSQVQKLYLTIVHKSFPEADVFFPEYSEFKKQISREEKQGPEFTYTFFILGR
jgi:dihydrofolate reductase